MGLEQAPANESWPVWTSWLDEPSAFAGARKDEILPEEGAELPTACSLTGHVVKPARIPSALIICEYDVRREDVAEAADNKECRQQRPENIAPKNSYSSFLSFFLTAPFRKMSTTLSANLCLSAGVTD